MITLTFYDGRDDAVELLLRDDGVNLTQQAYADLTDVLLLCRPAEGGAVITLQESDADDEITVDDAGQRLLLELGKAADLPVGRYFVQVVGQTAADPLGLVYADYSDLQIVKRA